MFSRKKPAPAKRRDRDLSQFGLFDIPDDFDPTGGMDDAEGGDSDLEAELAAITAGTHKQKPRPKPKTVIPASDLDKMVQDSMRDIGSDEELSGDDDDPDLLGELQDLTGEAIDENASPESTANEEKEQIFLPTTTTNVIDILKTRIEMYDLAEKTAKAAGEDNRARRFNRGLKTLKDMFRQANVGKSINVDEIPPELAVKKPATPPPSELKDTSSPIPPNSEDAQPPEKSPKIPEPEAKPHNPKIAALNARKHEYKVAALDAKKAGDKQSAMEFVKVLKQFDVVIKAAEEGQEVDLSDMPPTPAEFKEFLVKMQAAAEAIGPGSEEPAPPPPEPVLQSTEISEPTNLLEALQQRLDKYKSVEAAAKAEDNTSKARRFGRIVKQYEDAIKLYKTGRSVPFDELPAPPGFGPLPIEGAASAAPVPTPTPAPSKPTPVQPVRTPPKAQPDEDSDTSPKPTPQAKAPLRKQESTSRISGNHVSTTLMEKQMTILLERQKEFKLAAIEAKKSGEIEQAKEYLKIYKGFEALLDAASGGLPVDLSTLPIPPSQRENLEDSFALVTNTDCDPELTDDITDISVRLEEQLAKQLMMCKNTRDHHKAMGDITGMNRFENLALSVQKDLDLVRFSRRKKQPIPKFHYEQKSFNIVHCNTDLTENELEITVVRGITYSVPNPKDVDTYVKVEFPYPQEDPFRTKTSVAKNTDSPDYDQRFKVEFQRTSRQCQRMFKRHGVKLEIFSRGGFLRSDVLIGTVNVKLQPLETKCDIHDSFPVMDGRKSTGGKLEVKIRIRNPILTKQIEHVNEKWLVLDH